MSRLLYIEASPMKTTSTSIEIASAFLKAYQDAHPHDEIDRIDLWNIDLPHFDAEMIAAKFAVLRAQNATAEQRARWEQAVAIAKRFNAADKYLFSVPMWNFGIPYRLKHFIDIVTLPGQNWSWSREAGYRSLLADRKAVLIYSSAGAYPLAPDEDESDFQKPYLRRWLRFLGIEVAHEINVGPTLVAADALKETKTAAMERARAMAAAY
jgi:FMN-dependent NADH-azoreductase